MVKFKKNIFSVKSLKKNLKKYNCNFSNNNPLIAAIKIFNCPQKYSIKKYYNKNVYHNLILHQQNSNKIIKTICSCLCQLSIKGGDV